MDFDIFERMTPPNPSKRHAAYHAMDLNFALKPNSKAVDAGVIIPTVNDGFAGRAPDLGAIEIRQARAQVRTALVGLATVLPITENSSASFASLRRRFKAFPQEAPGNAGGC